jgi:hypothetical protein
MIRPTQLAILLYVSAAKILGVRLARPIQLQRDLKRARLPEPDETAKTNKHGAIETDQNGQMRVECKERPRLISELSPSTAKLIEM